MPTTELDFADLERELTTAFGVTPTNALRRRIDDHVSRAVAAVPARRRRLGWLSAAMLVWTVLLVGAGFYIALRGQPTPSAMNPGQPLHCSGLVGQAPAEAAAALAKLGYGVVWTEEVTTSDDGRLGYAERVESMPAGVVLDIVTRGDEAEVRVTPVDDPLARTAATRAEAERTACE